MCLWLLITTFSRRNIWFTMNWEGGMLYNDTLFSELYWTSISNLAKEMMNEYLEQDAHFISLLPENKGEVGK